MKTKSSYLIMLMVSLSLSSCLRRSADEEASSTQSVTAMMLDETITPEVDAIDATVAEPDPDDGLLSLEQFNDIMLDKFQEAICLAHFVCLDEELPTSFLTLLARTSTMSECREDLTQTYLGFNVITQEEVDAGLREYHPESALACIEFLSRASEEMTCAELLSLMAELNRDDTACTNTLNSLQPLGAPCSHNQHCAGSAVCELPGEMMCEIGQCVPDEEEDQLLRGEGESCEHRSCEPGLYCGQDDICSPPHFVAEGEECTLEGPLFCARGLVCSVSATTFTRTFTCIPPVPEGESCYISYSCQRGLTCRGADFNTPMAGQCEPLGEEGAPCGFYERYDCQRHLTCQLNDDMSGVCTNEQTQCPLPGE